MKFSNALDIMHEGYAITREGWNGSGLFIKLVLEPKLCNKMYICIFKDDKLITPWTASQSDLLSDDWLQLPKRV